MNPFKKNKKQVGIFLTAGYPELNSTGKQILQLQKQGVDFIEIGIPFSDPLADGPVIQSTSSTAISNGMQLDILFRQLSEIKNEIHIPLVLMGYLNPVLRYGLDRFLDNCRKLNISHVIFPDMSPEIYARYYEVDFMKYGVHSCFLVTPKTEDTRIQFIAEKCKDGFVYLVSDNSTTGNKSAFDSNRSKEFERIKTLCSDVPLFIGFGIRKKSDVDFVHSVADGAIIGSAYLKAVEEKREIEFVNIIANC